MFLCVCGGRDMYIFMYVSKEKKEGMICENIISRKSSLAKFHNISIWHYRAIT